MDERIEKIKDFLIGRIEAVETTNKKQPNEHSKGKLEAYQSCLSFLQYVKNGGK